MDEVKIPVPPDAGQLVWVSYDDEGFFSVPRTEAELRVYFEIEPGLAEQRQEGTTFEDWIEECERHGLLIPQRPDAPFLTVSWSRSDVAEILAGLLLPDTDANIAAVISDEQVIARLRDACSAAGHDALLDGVERLAESDRLARHPVSAGLDAALGSRSDVEVVPIEFINGLIEGGVQYWAITPGVFAAEEPGGGFTIIDNSTGDCFTETFATLTAAIAYIDGADAADAHRIDRDLRGGDGRLAPLPLERIEFGDAIIESGDCLIFRITADFDTERVFGMRADTVTVDYDRMSESLGDLRITQKLEGHGSKHTAYPLDHEQRFALHQKLDDFCMDRFGSRLAAYADERLGYAYFAQVDRDTVRRVEDAYVAGVDLDAEAQDLRGVADGVSGGIDHSDLEQDAR